MESANRAMPPVAPQVPAELLLIHSEPLEDSLTSGLRRRYLITSARTIRAAIQRLTDRMPAVVVTENAMADGSAIDICNGINGRAAQRAAAATVLLATQDVGAVASYWTG